ncbi:MAG: hypothetical protein M3R03_10510 [Pseudomonadota bacterium]|nr:hypothetical protein [Pseudomonadota bacterium]
MQLSNFLRTVLKLDAASCLAMAAILVPAAGSLQAPLGIDSIVLQGSGLALLPLGLFILWLGTRREAPVLLVWAVIIGNVGWTSASFIAASGLPGITPLGQSLVVGQAVTVLTLAFFEWRGLRSSAADQPAHR